MPIDFKMTHAVKSLVQDQEITLLLQYKQILHNQTCEHKLNLGFTLEKNKHVLSTITQSNQFSFKSNHIHVYGNKIIITPSSSSTQVLYVD